MAEPTNDLTLKGLARNSSRHRWSPGTTTSLPSINASGKRTGSISGRSSPGWSKHDARFEELTREIRRILDAIERRGGDGGRAGNRPHPRAPATNTDRTVDHRNTFRSLITSPILSPPRDR